MTKVIVDSEAAGIHAVLRALGLANIATVGHFRELVGAMQQAEVEAVRSRILTARGHGFVAGQEVQIGREIYRVSGTPSRFEMDLESMVRAPIPDPKRSVPAYGTDRPYLKKKKGRS